MLQKYCDANGCNCFAFSKVIQLAMVTRNILLVEDDILINRAWTLGLSQSGYDVTSAPSVSVAKRLLKERKFDAAIIDVNLQDGSGLDILRWIRTEEIAIKVLCVTARQDEETAIWALQRGATEFIRKPIGPRELTVRLDRLFLYTKEEPIAQIHFHELSINESSKEVFYLGNVLKLSPSEYQIFHTLLHNAGRPVSRENLLQALDLNSEASDRTIDSHISRIRKKLKDCKADDYAIESVWGNGYSLICLSGKGETS